MYCMYSTCLVEAGQQKLESPPSNQARPAPTHVLSHRMCHCHTDSKDQHARSDDHPVALILVETSQSARRGDGETVLLTAQALRIEWGFALSRCLVLTREDLLKESSATDICIWGGGGDEGVDTVLTNTRVHTWVALTTCAGRTVSQRCCGPGFLGTRGRPVYSH